MALNQTTKPTFERTKNSFSWAIADERTYYRFYFSEFGFSLRCSQDNLTFALDFASRNYHLLEGVLNNKEGVDLKTIKYAFVEFAHVQLNLEGIK